MSRSAIGINLNGQPADNRLGKYQCDAEGRRNGVCGLSAPETPQPLPAARLTRTHSNSTNTTATNPAAAVQRNTGA